MLAALAMDVVAFRPVRRAAPTTMLLTSFGLAIIIQALFQMFVSPRSRAVPQPAWILSSITVGGVRIPTNQILTIVVTAVSLALLLVVLKRTLIGTAMRSASEDFDATRLMGIRANRVIAAAFAISGLLAGIACVLILTRRGSVDPTMGFEPLLKAFVANVVGGMGSLFGAVAGGLLLGFVEVAFARVAPRGHGRSGRCFRVCICCRAASRSPRRAPRCESDGTRVTAPATRKLAALGGSVALFALLAAGVTVYTAGSAANERVATILLVDLLIVVGLQLFIGNSGVVSFGHVGFAAIAAYVTAILSVAPAIKTSIIPDAPLGLGEVHLGPVVAGLCAVIFTGLFGALIGLAVVRLSGLTASIFTLAILIVVHEVITNWVDLTGGNKAFHSIPLETTLPKMLIIAFLAIVVARLFRESAFGLRLQASREDELAATAVGVRVARSRFVAWTVSVLIVAAAGVLRAQLLGVMSPRELYFHLTFLTLAMLVLGGMRSVTGAVLGTVAVTAGAEYPRFLGDGPEAYGFNLPQIFGLTELFIGAVVIVVMIVRPSGLVGDRELDDLARSAWARVRRRRTLVDAVEDAPESATPRMFSPSSPAEPAQLHVEQATMAFQGLVALNEVTLDVRSGEIVGLIGPNGAGKTTLLNVVTSILVPTGGEVLLDGRRVSGLDPATVARLGIARTFQNIRLFGTLSVRQNVEVARSLAVRHRAAGDGMSAESALASFGLTTVADRRAATLPYGEQRQLEMARALALRPAILLLDEPAAGMNDVESEHLMDLVRTIRDEHGCGILVIDHDLHFIMGVCDRIYVLAGGRMISQGSPEDVRRDPAVITAYLGSHAREQTQRLRLTADAPAMVSRIKQDS